MGEVDWVFSVLQVRNVELNCYVHCEGFILGEEGMDRSPWNPFTSQCLHKI